MTNPYLNITKAEAIQRLDQYIAKISNKVTENRGNRTLVTKVFLQRIKELLLDGQVQQPATPKVTDVSVEREGYMDQKIWNKALGENPYEVDSEPSSSHRRWNRGWWLAKNGKSEPKEDDHA